MLCSKRSWVHLLHLAVQYADSCHVKMVYHNYWFVNVNNLATVYNYTSWMSWHLWITHFEWTNGFISGLCNNLCCMDVYLHGGVACDRPCVSAYPWFLFMPQCQAYILRFLHHQRHSYSILATNKILSTSLTTSKQKLKQSSIAGRFSNH